MIKPEDFKDINELKEVYKGLLRNYHVVKTDIAKLLREKTLTKKPYIV